MKTKLFLFTWPSSQIFVGQKDAILVLPPEEDVKGTLDSAYLVPSKLIDKVKKMTQDKDSMYYGMEMPLPEGEYVRNDKYEGDDLLQDYNGYTYQPVKEK